MYKLLTSLSDFLFIFWVEWKKLIETRMTIEMGKKQVDQENTTL